MHRRGKQIDSECITVEMVAHARYVTIVHTFVCDVYFSTY